MKPDSVKPRLSKISTSILIGIIFLSTLGDEVALIAFVFKIESVSSSGLSISLLLAAQLVPGILLSPFSGQLIDRFETTRVLVITIILQGLFLCLLATTNHVGLIFLGATVLGCLFTVSEPALFTLLPTIVKSSTFSTTKIAGANTIVEISQRFGSLIGPVLGGLIIAQTASTSIAFLIDGATFLIAAPVIWFSGIRRPSIEMEKNRGKKFFKEVFVGIQILWQDSALRIVIPVFSAVVLVSSISDVAFIFLVRKILQGSSITYGILVAAWGGGIIFGALLGSTLLVKRQLELFSMLGATLIGISLGLSGIFPLLEVVVITYVIGGMANGLFNVAIRTLLHQRVLDRMYGRVFSAYLALRNIAVITGYIIGASFAVESSRSVYIVSGALGTMVGVFGIVIVSLVLD